MATTYTEILEKLQDQQAQAMKEKSLDWFLGQIKTVVKETKNAQKQMTVTTVDEAISEAKREGKIFNSPEEARAAVTKNNVIGITSTFNTQNIGQMMMFKYDPRWKEKLPYWDQYPLIFPIKTQIDRTLGINMHYLPPYERARLMQALYATLNNKRFDRYTQLRVSYEILNGSTRYKFFKPCIKCYLHEHLRSRPMIINPANWTYVLLLPLANFIKATDAKVWQDSINKIR